ncbi:MAG: phosphatidate cytidylyltransferase [Anaerolineales bacterium]
MLSQRTLSACVLLPVVAVLVWLGGYPLAIALAVAAVLATKEVLDLSRRLGATPSYALALPMAVALVADGVFPQWGVLSWCMLLLPLGLLAIEVGHQNRPGSLLSWAVAVAAPLYVGYALGYWARLRTTEQGIWWLAIALVGTWIADSGAYFVGVKWGKRKLATAISPKKTWEGVAGELAGALLSVTPFALLVLHVPWWAAVAMAVALAAAAVIGDLAESVIKRQAGVKDSSNLIPGHGGMLDRVDSLLFVVPVIYIARMLLAG